MCQGHTETFTATSEAGDRDTRKHRAAVVTGGGEGGRHAHRVVIKVINQCDDTQQLCFTKTRTTSTAETLMKLTM